MLWYIIINIIIALFTILLLHHIWNYLKENYSVKKTKDLAEFQSQKYKDIFLTLSNSPENKAPDLSSTPIHTEVSLPPPAQTEWLAKEEEQWMTQELNHFMDELSMVA